MCKFYEILEIVSLLLGKVKENTPVKVNNNHLKKNMSSSDSIYR